jgi:hypothetical protein
VLVGEGGGVGAHDDDVAGGGGLGDDVEVRLQGEQSRERRADEVLAIG